MKEGKSLRLDEKRDERRGAESIVPETRREKSLMLIRSISGSVEAQGLADHPSLTSLDVKARMQRGSYSAGTIGGNEAACRCGTEHDPGHA